MKVTIEVSETDLHIIGQIKQLIENNRPKLGLNQLRALSIVKTLYSAVDVNNSNSYERKINSGTLIHDSK